MVVSNEQPIKLTCILVLLLRVLDGRVAEEASHHQPSDYMYCLKNILINHICNLPPQQLLLPVTSVA